MSRRLFYIYRNWYYLWVELSGWMGSVTYGLGADLSLPPCLSVTTSIWTLAHKSDPQAEISGEIVWYDALAPRPRVLLSWRFFAHAQLSSNSSPYHIRGNEMNWLKWIHAQCSRHLLVPVSLTCRRISHLVGWSELGSENRPFCPSIAFAKCPKINANTSSLFRILFWKNIWIYLRLIFFALFKSKIAV